MLFSFLKFACWLITRFFVFLALLTILFVLANGIGAFAPANIYKNINVVKSDSITKEIVIVSNMIHSDIALPFDDKLKERFQFLDNNGVSFSDPNIKYMLFGWGSRTFYTSAKEWTDIRPQALMKAITGDGSVMHVSPAGDVATLQSSIRIKLNQPEYTKLLDILEQGFDKNKANAGLLEGYSYGYGDQFFTHKDHFSILNTCNVWVSKTLNKIGVKTGYWTPIVQAFKYSLQYHSPKRLRFDN